MQRWPCLRKLGIRSALVAASGDLAFGDPPPGQRGWKIGVDSTVLELRNAAVSTSGDAEQASMPVASGTRTSSTRKPDGPHERDHSDDRGATMDDCRQHGYSGECARRRSRH